MARLALIIILALRAVITIANNWSGLAHITAIVLMHCCDAANLFAQFRFGPFFAFNRHSISLAGIRFSDVVLTLGFCFAVVKITTELID